MNIKIKTNNNDDAVQFIKFLKTIEQCCRTGSSRELKMIVDGDGSAHMFFDFEIEGADEIKPADLEGELKFYIGE